MSSNKICEEESDSECGITEKLKSTGRISLSDITAATIGPLDAVTWDADQSEGPNNMISNSVHRPWTSVTQPGKGTVPNTEISPNEDMSGTTLISIQPLLTSQFKRKCENEESNFLKRVRTEPRPRQSFGMTDFQMSKRNNSRQFDFSALAQSVQEPNNYSALSSAIKTESLSDLSVTETMNVQLGLKHGIQQYTPAMTEMEPHITSIPVSGFKNLYQGYSSTFTTPDSAFQMPRFQPWVQGSPQTELCSPMTPIKSANMFETNTSYLTPINVQKLTTEEVKTSINSPGLDSRFNDSLSNLLGSPYSGSPISKNPFFSALQNVLESDCKKEIVPQSLMDIHSEKFGQENIFIRERKLHERFNALQESSPDEVRQLSGFYRYQSALIETERFRTLHECNYPVSYKDTVNKHYDDKLHSVMDRVEQSVVLLENANKENKLSNKGGKPRPHLNKEAVKIMEDWYQQNLDHPYPSSTVYDWLALQGNVGVEQVKKWFANKRNRTHNTRTLTEIAMKKRKLNLISK